MDSQRELRTEFRRALDAVLPPAPWLEAAVIEHLHEPRSRGSIDRSLGRRQKRAALPRAAFQVAAAVLVLVLAAAAVTTFIELRYHRPQVTPAGADPVRAYQTMVINHINKLDSSFDGVSCTTLESTCPAPGKPALTELQRWLDDLNRSQPPARFAVIDAQLRRHLTADILDLNALISAHAARDQNAFALVSYAANSQLAWLDVAARSIGFSQPTSPAAYIAAVRTGKANIGACTACLSLGSAAAYDCTGTHALGCEVDAVNAASTIGDFEAALVRAAAPSSLAAQNASLQRDLAQADTGLLAMASAAVTGDQAGSDSGRLLLNQALTAVDADIAAILNG